MTAATHSSRTPAPPQSDDERTVGDLLVDADITARELLWDAPPDTAKAKARSWGEVVEAAAELWSSFPDRTADPSMERIHKLTVGMHRTQQRTGWPGPGEGDPQLDRVVGNLSRATEMVASRRHPTGSANTTARSRASGRRIPMHRRQPSAPAAGRRSSICARRPRCFDRRNSRRSSSTRNAISRC